MPQDGARGQMKDTTTAGGIRATQGSFFPSFFTIFIFFAQNIYCGYKLEPPY